MVKKTKKEVLSGVCEFHSETGTEGGHWAFRDERFMTPHMTHFICKKCRMYWDKKRIPDEPYFPNRASDFCAPGKHDFKIAFPTMWSHEGLHVLEDGDYLTIYSKNSSKKIAIEWSGVISLKELGVFKAHAYGMWIHTDQKGIVREVWAQYFLGRNPAKLIKAKSKKEKR